MVQPRVDGNGADVASLSRLTAAKLMVGTSSSSAQFQITTFIEVADANPIIRNLFKTSASEDAQTHG